MPSIITEQQQHIDSGGTPIVNGYIYIGSTGNDPKLIANRITIYSDRDLSTPLANPQRTNSLGMAVNKIWIPGKYSIAIHDSEDAQKKIDLDAGEIPETGITQLTNIQGTNTVIADGEPAIDTLKDNQMYIFRAVGGNTGAMTLQIDLTPQYPIKKQHDQAMASGDVETGQTIAVVWNAGDSVYEMVTPPLVLSATDFNVSNDLTVGNNVIITGDVDAATGTIDSFDATTIESSTITKSTIPVYGMVMITPEELVDLTTIPATATQVNSTTLGTAGATHAMLRIYANVVASGAGSAVRTIGVHNTSTVTADTDDYLHVVTDPVVDSRGENDVMITVPLDGNSDFWYRATQGVSGAAASERINIWLVGYYV